MQVYNGNSSLQVLEQQFAYSGKRNGLLNNMEKNALICLVIWTLDDTVVWCNKYTRLMAGLSEDVLTGTISINSILSKDIVCCIKEAFSDGIEDKNQQHIYSSLSTLKNGKNAYIVWNHYAIRNDAGIGYIVSAGIDITGFINIGKQLEEVKSNLTAVNKELEAQQGELSAVYKKLMAEREEIKNNLIELKRYQEELIKSEERYKLIIDSSCDGLLDWDLIDDRVYISENWSNLLGFEKQEVYSYREKLKKIIHPKDFSRFTERLDWQLEKKSPIYQNEYRIRLKNGRYIWISSKGKILWNEQGMPVRIIGSHTDITEQKKIEGKLKHLAYYDSLTNALLRTTFMEKLNNSIESAKRSGLQLAVLFLDLDNFKVINDTYGHHAGDRLLKKIAVKLKSCISTSDILSRMGGDEFAILVTDQTRINHLDEIALRIIKTLNKPLNVNRHKLYTSISIGIAVYPYSGLNGETLVKNADIAMYMAKKSGKNNYQYFDRYIMKEIRFQYDVKKDLATAIGKGEFFLCYQPIIDTMTKRITSVEALIRWKHPRKGIISPLQFIPVAEETRLIVPIGLWVLRTACRQLKEWYKTGFTDICLSVNVSVIQLQRSDFGEAVSGILSETGLPPECLELEITESVLLESSYAVTRNLNYLKKQGVRISIDDFGIGYNSFKYIQELDINGIKIDRTFINNIKVNVNKTIIDAIIKLGHDMNIEITAEGVETEEQYNCLKKKRCDKIQGYYFSKPLLPEEAGTFIKAHTIKTRRYEKKSTEK